MGCEVNIYVDDDGWRIELSSGQTGRGTTDEPSYWIVSVDDQPTREDAERIVLERFDALGFFPTPESSVPLSERAYQP